MGGALVKMKGIDFESFELPDFGAKFEPKHGNVKGQSINVMALCQALGYSVKDVNRLWRHFIQADLTGNNVLCIREFCIMHQIFNRSFGKLVFAIFDYDNSGDITFEEFCVAAWNSFTLDDSALPMFAFRLFDKDNSGSLSANELRKMLKIVCGKNEKTIEVANRYIKENDVNDDGLISASEFLSITKRSQLIMFPAFQMRDHMRHKILNYSRWQSLTAKRMKMFPGLMLPDILASLQYKPEGYQGLYVAAGGSSGGYLLPSILPSQKLFDVPVIKSNTSTTGGKPIAAREGEAKVTIGGRTMVKSGKEKDKTEKGKSLREHKKSVKEQKNSNNNSTDNLSNVNSIRHEKDKQDIKATASSGTTVGTGTGGGEAMNGGGQRKGIGSLQSSAAHTPAAHTPVHSVPPSPRSNFGSRLSFTATLGQGPGPGNAPGQGPGPLRTSIESLNKRLANSNENGQGYIGLGGVDHNAQGGGVGVQVPLASLGGHAEKKPHTHLSSAMALVFGEKAAPVITQTAENVAYALLDIDLSEPRPLPATTLGQSIAAVVGEKDKKSKHHDKENGKGRASKNSAAADQSNKSSNNGNSQKRAGETIGGGGQSGSGLTTFLVEEKKSRKKSVHDHALKYEYKGGDYS